MVKEATSLKLEKDVMIRVREESKKENRSINNYIETVLIKHFREIDETKNPAD